MRILHIAPHLGGGVGKAHATVMEAERRDGSSIRRSYVLLEAPRDTTYAERVRASGCELHVSPAPAEIAALAAEADIVQIEWWNHPRLYGLLASEILPALRLVLWTHISGLAAPLIPRRLVETADHVLFTSPCSLDAPNLKGEIRARPGAFGVANSGFGFDGIVRADRTPGTPLRCGYIGTLDFVKLHPRLFDFLDAVESPINVGLWGEHDPQGPVAARAAAMRRPGRVRFEGYADRPANVLADLDLFVYLLAPGHYGTGENALVEAMSAGAVPIVWGNPAEAAIVSDGETGRVVRSGEDFVATMAELSAAPARLARLSAAARIEAARRHSPAATALALADAYRAALSGTKRSRPFHEILGLDARAWFESSVAELMSEGAVRLVASLAAAKGSLAHFRACFPADPSLAGWMPAGSQAGGYSPVKSSGSLITRFGA
ncbi:glycosyltransferase family 4 protein [Methylobacterium sp. J-026]|uniref:glycosyltransferase n=1 Tax=Methylobacterium sp. J-026 TaxID=2836624 RepID=UPI001FB9BF7D|nr:glycosyltransferase family 4 protein [Methylobacterium sp. J-026]MCJ2134415.1 glycosyltransferase family 4 protein [Methylobacterium sp. J-026]